MIKKPSNYEEVAVRTDITKSLKDGFYAGVIKQAKVRTSTIQGNKQDILTVFFDICEGDYKDYFKNKYDSNPKPAEEKRWACSYDFFLESPHNSKEQVERAAKKLKAFAQYLEACNENYKWDWDETKLKDKKIGLGFGLREFTGSDGKIYTTPELRDFTTLKRVAEIDPSDLSVKYKVKCLDRRYVPYEEYMGNKIKEKAEEEGFITIEDTDDIPF